MSKRARQIPDPHHSFIELQQLWKQGTYTLEEGVTQLLHTLIRFEERRAQFDLKMLPYRATLEELESFQPYEPLEVQTEINDFLQAMEKDKSMAYQAMDFALEHFATLELRFVQMERECEELLRKLDTKSSHLN